MLQKFLCDDAYGRIEHVMVGQIPAAMPMALTSLIYSYSIMLLIHQGHQSKVKVVAKAKSTGLYSLSLSGPSENFS